MVTCEKFCLVVCSSGGTGTWILGFWNLASAVPWRNGLKTSGTRLFFIFCHIYFPNWSAPHKVLHNFEKSSKISKICQKNEKKPYSTCILKTHLSDEFWVLIPVPWSLILRKSRVQRQEPYILKALDLEISKMTWNFV